MKRLLFGGITALTILASLLPAFAQNGLRQTPLGFCSMSSMSSATLINATTCVRASFTATGSGTNLTTSSVTGLILPLGGDQLTGTGVPTGTYIISQTSGTPGGAGVYVTNNPTTSNAASLTSGGVPLTATYAVFCAYTQAVNWRDDGIAPTGTVGTGGQGIPAGSCIPYNGTIANIQFIQQTSGAIVGASFYR